MKFIIGCKFHPGCCIPDDQISNAALKRHVWETKKQWMESVGTLYTMRECKWAEILYRTPESLLPTTDIPRILIKDTKGTVTSLK